MWSEIYQQIPTLGCILFMLTGSNTTEGNECQTEPERFADHTINTIYSPHSYRNSPICCRWEIRTRNANETVFVRVYFRKVETMLDCTKTFVDILDGYSDNSPILGRWCDMNSTLMTSSGTRIAVLSQSSGVRFDFQVMYCLHSFSMPEIQQSGPRQLTVLEIAGIAISAFLGLFILSCAVHKFCNPCKTQQRPSNTRNNQSPFTVTFSAASEGQESRVYFQGPPDYWTAVSSDHSRNKTETPNEQPPSYSEVVASASH